MHLAKVADVTKIDSVRLLVTNDWHFVFFCILALGINFQSCCPGTFGCGCSLALLGSIGGGDCHRPLIGMLCAYLWQNLSKIVPTESRHLRTTNPTCGRVCLDTCCSSLSSSYPKVDLDFWILC